MGGGLVGVRRDRSTRVKGRRSPPPSEPSVTAPVRRPATHCATQAGVGGRRTGKARRAAHGIGRYRGRPLTGPPGLAPAASVRPGDPPAAAIRERFSVPRRQGQRSLEHGGRDEQTPRLGDKLVRGCGSIQRPFIRGSGAGERGNASRQRPPQLAQTLIGASIAALSPRHLPRKYDAID